MTKTKIVSKHSPITHLGYFTKDAKAFAQRHHDLYGTGPFIVMENVPAENYFRGEKTVTDLTIVTGWYKDLAIEIIQQNSDNDSYMTENGRYGFHHIAIVVDDIKEAIKEFEECGDGVQMFNFDNEQFPFAYIDARESCGYYIELNPFMDFMSSVVKGWAEDWDGETKLFRGMEDIQQG